MVIEATHDLLHVKTCEFELLGSQNSSYCCVRTDSELEKLLLSP